MMWRSRAWRFTAKQFCVVEAALQKAAGPLLDVAVALPGIACHILEVCKFMHVTHLNGLCIRVSLCCISCSICKAIRLRWLPDQEPRAFVWFDKAGR